MAKIKAHGNEIVITPESLEEHAELNEFLVSIKPQSKSVSGLARVTKYENSGEFGQFSIEVEA